MAKARIRATFGVTGRWAEANPVLVHRMAADGHQIVNHTYDHQSFTGLSTSAPPLTREQRVAEIQRADAAIRTATGGTGTSGWFRPPYGDRDATVDADVGAAGYPYELLWTVDSTGWRGTSVDAVIKRVLDAAAPGTIYLFHVGSASTDAAALPQIIAGLTAAGYSFVTASQIAAR